MYLPPTYAPFANVQINNLPLSFNTSPLISTVISFLIALNRAVIIPRVYAPCVLFFLSLFAVLQTYASKPKLVTLIEYKSFTLITSISLFLQFKSFSTSLKSSIYPSDLTKSLPVPQGYNVTLAFL